MCRQQGRIGFSLIELVIVVMIMGVITVIAIPRISRGTEGAAEAALQQDLGILRDAIALHGFEHPDLIPTSEMTLEGQLTLYTDRSGNESPIPTATHVCGPYLVKMPPLPVGANRGSTAVRYTGSPGDGDEGWFYDLSTSDIVANTKDDDVDLAGTPYNEY